MDKKDLSVIGDSEYVQMIEKIKKSYKDRQLKAALSVNSEMLRFYYSLGEEIISLKAESRWGSGFYKKLSSDLQKEIPNVKGFSVTNLKYMRKFYEMYSPLNRQQPVDDLQMIFSIPWGHHIFLMTKCKNRGEAFLENISQPICISKYEISKLLKKEYTSSLPTIEEIEKSIKEIDIEN